MKIKYIIITIIAVIILGAAFWFKQAYLTKGALTKEEHQHEIWYCPMHPHYTSDRPGQCPICGMNLVKRQLAAKSKEDELEDYTTVSLNDSQQQLAGIKTIEVVTKEALKTVRAVGQYEGVIYTQIGKVNAQIFENDVDLIKRGQKAIIEMPAYGQRYEGEVRYVDLDINVDTRSTNVLIWLKEFDRRKTRSNVLVNVTLPVNLGKAIIVPRDAVMDTGLRKIVFVQKDKETFEPREIKTGAETDEGLIVVSGIRPGERIVASGNFLLDSESRIQSVTR